MSIKHLLAGGGLLFAFLAVAVGGTAGASGPPTRTYQVTLRNLTHGQPFSPGVVASHRPQLHIFRTGAAASAGIEAIAEDGNEAPALTALQGEERVTDIVDINRPLTPAGTVVGNFNDSFSFQITAHPGERLSLATMLNDGFTGLDGGLLPQHGSRTFLLNGYDAGTEDNTERSADIVDACSALGPVRLAGDPNGNEDAAVDTTPHGVVQMHPGIQGGADLIPAQHGWTGPVAELTIETTD